MQNKKKHIHRIYVPHKNDVRFLFISSCLYEGSCHIYVICVCLGIVVSNTYCIVFLLWFIFVLCILYCQFLWNVNFWLHFRHSLMSIFVAPSVFSNDYFQVYKITEILSLYRENDSEDRLRTNQYNKRDDFECPL